MAMKMATKHLLGALLVVIMLATQWTPLHARSMPGELDTQEYVPVNGAYEQFASQDLNPESTMPSFATVSDVPTAPTWDSFATQTSYNYDGSFAAVDAEPGADVPFDSFVDSPETVTQPDTTSLADDTVVQANQAPPTYTQKQYDNDEVFYDTSDAETVYRAPDE